MLLSYRVPGDVLCTSSAPTVFYADASGYNSARNDKEFIVFFPQIHKHVNE